MIWMLLTEQHPDPPDQKKSSDTKVCRVCTLFGSNDVQIKHQALFYKMFSSDLFYQWFRTASLLHIKRWIDLPPLHEVHESLCLSYKPSGWRFLRQLRKFIFQKLSGLNRQSPVAAKNKKSEQNQNLFISVFSRRYDNNCRTRVIYVAVHRLVNPSAWAVRSW